MVKNHQKISKELFLLLKWLILFTFQVFDFSHGITLWLNAVWMQLPIHIMLVIHSSIGLSSNGCHIGKGRISSGGVSWPVERSGAAKPGAKAFLESLLAWTCVSSCVSSFPNESWTYSFIVCPVIHLYLWLFYSRAFKYLHYKKVFKALNHWANAFFL